MAKRLKIEGVDAISVLNFNWSMSEPLKGILRVEKHDGTSESNNFRTATNINEA